MVFTSGHIVMNIRGLETFVSAFQGACHAACSPNAIDIASYVTSLPVVISPPMFQLSGNECNFQFLAVNSVIVVYS